jgi:nucleoside 2-deoxyribosyltransferase
MNNRIYLAGPEVFLPNPKEIGARKKAICRAHGLEGLYPADPEIKDQASLGPSEVARQIYANNLKLMDACAGVIANLTPFRGVSMDAGTAFEVGYMAASKRLVLGYTNVTANYQRRSARYYEIGAAPLVDPYTAGTAIEEFGLAENLMIELAVRNCSAEIVVSEVEPGTELTSLDGFERCVVQARRLLDTAASERTMGQAMR